MPLNSPITLAVERFIQDMTNLPADIPIEDVLQNALVAEHEIRLLLTRDAQNPQLADKFLGLFKILDLPLAARRHRERQIDPETNSFYEHHVFPLPQNRRKMSLLPSTVLNIQAFKRNWEIFTHRALAQMSPNDWKNVIAAGGSVMACIKRPNLNTPAKRLNEYYQSTVYGSSDIDLFLWGLTPVEAETKMKAIYRAVCEATAWKVTCVRKANTVSLHTRFPYRPIQIILRLYQSPAEILAGFDIDSACCAYDGSSVWSNPRFLAALVRQSNTIDLTRRSPSYEVRLAKYARRGFEVSVPNLRRDQVKKSLYTRDLPALPNGLARLLVLEAAYFRPDFYTRIRFPYTPHSLNRSTRDSMIKEGSEFTTNDYDGHLGWAQIPYGPSWDADKIEALVAKKDANLNSPHNCFNEEDPEGNWHRHVFYAGTMEQCLGAFCQNCDNSEISGGATSSGSGVYIKGPIKFMMINPGQQLATGSFHPINEGEWAVEAYEDPDNVGTGAVEGSPDREWVDTPTAFEGHMYGWVPGRSE